MGIVQFESTTLELSRDYATRRNGSTEPPKTNFGELGDGPSDPNDWPYKTPLEANRDGWRVIQFPNMALIMDESKAYGLGCEFILER